MDKIEVKTLSEANKSDFINELVVNLTGYFDADVNNLPTNYGNKLPWSLISLIASGEIDTYQMLYVNDQFWGASGGMVREFNGKKIYQGGFRWFSNAEKITQGLGCMKAYSHTHKIGHQFDRAKLNGCSELILSFNDYNYRLFEISRRYHLRKAFPDRSFIPSATTIMFNGTPQWLLTTKID
jgi:hypothetical protein